MEVVEDESPVEERGFGEPCQACMKPRFAQKQGWFAQGFLSRMWEWWESRGGYEEINEDFPIILKYTGEI